MIPNTPPNLPLAPKEYNPQWADDVLKVLRLYFNQYNLIAPAIFSSLSLRGLVGSTLLANNITNVQTTIPLADATNFPNSGSGTLNGTEKFSWTAKSGNTLTGVTRGILGTTPVHHNQHDVVIASATTGDVYAHPTTRALYVVF